MCTSSTLPLPNGRQLFGRTLDLDAHFNEQVVLTPRGYFFAFGYASTAAPLEPHYAMVGMASVVDGYPLYAEAVNECGLCMAGLRFAGYAQYASVGKDAPDGGVDLAPWELIPYLLSRCDSLPAAQEVLQRVRVVERPFVSSTGITLPTAPLHWHLADAVAAHGSLVLEVTAAGTAVTVSDAWPGVMANDPPYAVQLASYEALRRGEIELPGGPSSPARFLRAAYYRTAMVDALAVDSIGQNASTPTPTPIDRFFQLMAVVSPPLGAHPVGKGFQRTLYTCCMDGAAATYHWNTEACLGVRSVSMHDMNIAGNELLLVEKMVGRA